MEADRLTYGKTFHQIATGTIQLDEGMMSCSGNDRVESPFTISPVVAISGVLLWQSVERLLNPAPVMGFVAIVAGLAAAVANWGVTRLLWAPGRNNAAIRLAYIHNIGDVYVSLAPVLAGVLVTVSGYSFFDPLIAGGIALWIIGSTLREVIGSHEELIWPEKVVCGHSDRDETAPAPR
jgi:divalent metal cation (Fe/Co/Zn/Cd) transporter